MQANSSGAEFLSTISKFMRRMNFVIACLRPPQNLKLGIFTGSRAVEGKEMYKKAWCTCKVVVLPCQAYLTFSWPPQLEFKINIGNLYSKSLHGRLRKSATKPQRQWILREQIRNKFTTFVVIVKADLSCLLNVSHLWLKRNCFAKAAADRSCLYSCFEKGWRKKCTRQSRKVLWVVFRSLVFKEISKNGKEAMDICAKGKQQK